MSVPVIRHAVRVIVLIGFRCGCVYVLLLKERFHLYLHSPIGIENPLGSEFTVILPKFYVSRQSLLIRACGPSKALATIIFSSCSSMWEKAVQLLNEMRRKDLKPDRYSYTSAIHACAKAGNPVDALRLLRSMEANEVCMWVAFRFRRDQLY